MGLSRSVAGTLRSGIRWEGKIADRALDEEKRIARISSVKKVGGVLEAIWGRSLTEPRPVIRAKSTQRVLLHSRSAKYFAAQAEKSRLRAAPEKCTRRLKPEAREEILRSSAAEMKGILRSRWSATCEAVLTDLRIVFPFRFKGGGFISLVATCRPWDTNENATWTFANIAMRRIFSCVGENL